MTHDVVVIGGGIVGLATATALAKARPGLKVVVVEKEPAVGLHQTGRNSGVIHTGIYYRPGSLKARLCIEGRAKLLAFAAEHAIPHQIGGKLIVALTVADGDRLDDLAERAAGNGVATEWVAGRDLTRFEPHAAGLFALHVPGAGTISFRAVADRLAELIGDLGVEVMTGRRLVGSWTDGLGRRLELSTGEALRTRVVVVCAGLHGDRVASLLGLEPSVAIVPFRGEYWRLTRPDLVRSMIYPVPDPEFPFLGLHFTRRADGVVELGPNAVLALAREGYRWRDVNLRHLRTMFGTAGFWALARRYWRTGVAETARSLSATRVLTSARRLVPDLEEGDLVSIGAGVRAQAIDREGRLVDDFVIEESSGVVAVLNAPSPAATASLSIGERLAESVLARF